jgi:cysteine desulfurase / selenocysteine lyase
LIYFDHAATAHPRPIEVVHAVRDYMVEIGMNPGRAAYCDAAAGARVVYEAREDIAGLLGAKDASRVVFTHNATYALNHALFGMLGPGDRVVTTAIEHNSVMRPLEALRRDRNVEVVVVPADPQGRVDPADVGAAVAAGPTRLVCVNHASNVCGTLLSLRAIRAAIGDAPLLVDSAQTAGVVPIDVDADGVDLLAFTGHKGLRGPTGTGGLYIREGLDLQPWAFGGTGSDSASYEQPTALPERFESGTLNAAGIAGLGAAAHLLMEEGIEQVRAAEEALFRRLWAGLGAIEGVVRFGPDDWSERIGTVAINLERMSCVELAWELDRNYDIAVRAGLHCAPGAHRALGTFPEGTVRLAMGWSTTEEDVSVALAAVAELAKQANR